MDGLTIELENGDTYKFTFDNLEKQKAKHFRAEQDLHSRISLMFVAWMLVQNNRNQGLGQAVIDTVHDMESGKNRRRTKPASAFKRPPLAGLWHKHVFDAQFMPENYRLALPEHKRLDLAHQVADETEGMPHEERILALANRVFSEPFEERAKAGKLTGEWLVYLPRQGKNYYLAFTRHHSGPEEQDLLDGIVAGCANDFPDLPQWLEEARAARS